MDFYDVLEQVLDLLRQRGRVAYRVLRLQFKLDDEFGAGRALMQAMQQPDSHTD